MVKEELERLGFDLIKEQEHGQWVTQRYIRPPFEIELTYGWEGLVSSVIKIINADISFENIKKLTKINYDTTK